MVEGIDDKGKSGPKAPNNNRWCLTFANSCYIELRWTLSDVFIQLHDRVHKAARKRLRNEDNAVEAKQPKKKEFQR